jgi:hypothetical protein
VGEGGFGFEIRGTDARVHKLGDAFHHGPHEKEAGPLVAPELAETQDDGFLPLLGDLKTRGEEKTRGNGGEDGKIFGAEKTNS